jgi:hypothetical protein
VIRIDLGSSAAAAGLSLLIVLGGAQPAGTRPGGPSAPAAPVSAPAGDGSAAPRFDVRRLRPGTAPGLLFTTPQPSGPPTDGGGAQAPAQSPMQAQAQALAQASPKAPAAVNGPHGPEILDEHGRPVWFHPVPAGQFATDLRVQRYRGRDVLTWWQGTVTTRGGGIGTGYVADENYRVIATVRGTTAPADLHEFRITPRGTALATGYRTMPADLSSLGGAKDGKVEDSVVEEIDIATGRTLMSWSALAHVPPADSDAPPFMYGEQPFDYFHVNSVSEDTDGNLLISGRHLSTVFKVDRRTGRIIWRLGGRRTSFPLGAGVRFNWQHDATPAGRDTVKIFDNGANQLLEGYESRVAWIRVDPARRTTRLVRQITHPAHVSSTHEGSAQDLPNGNTSVSWGAAGRISEFSRSGALLFDATLPQGWTSYRLYRQAWTGRPAEPPTVSVRDGSVHAVWNGATGVARWRILAGDARDDLKPYARAGWNGLDTAVRLPSRAGAAPRYVKAEALDASGRVLGTSAVTPNTEAS